MRVPFGQNRNFIIFVILSALLEGRVSWIVITLSFFFHDMVDNESTF
jgi:hypothetical protein